jgi:PAS domain S-box-containing protein
MMQVLLVDDEPELAGVAKHFLESRKLMQVTCVESAEAALDLLEHREFQAIVSDYQMPRMNGIEFLKAIRAGGSRIPFILFTGRGREEVVIEALNSGADFYLQKGGDPRAQFAELGHKLRAAVAKHAAENEVRDQRARLEALIDSSDRAIFSVDTNYRYTAFNSYHREVMKVLYGADIEIGKSILECQTVEVDRKKAKANLDQALSGHRHVDSAFSGEDPRTRQEFLVSHTPIRTSDGTIVGVAVYADRVTDIGRVNEELEETRRRFDSLFAAYNEGVALHNLVYNDGKAVDYRILEVNQAYEKIVGISRDAAVGKLASKLYGANAAPYLTIYAKVAESGEPISFDTYFPPLDKYLSITVFTPAPGQFATVFMDITKRKLVEEELRQSHEMLEGIMNSLPVRVFWKDANLDFLGCNAAFARDAGLESPADLIGKSDYDMAWRDQADMYRADDMAVISSARPKLLIEEPQTRPDGGKVTLLTSKIPLLSSNGEIRGVLGTYMDISDYRNAEVSLRESEEMHRQMLDHAGIGIGYYDLDGKVIMFNALAAKHMNGMPADFTGHSIFELFGQEAGQFYYDRIVKAAGEEGATEYEDLVRLPTGDKWFLTLHKRVLDRNGKVIGVQVFSHDITGRKLAEMNLLQSELRYRSVTENANEGIVVAQDGLLRYCNPRALEMIQLTEAEAIGRQFIDLIHPDDRKLVGETYRRRVQGEEVPSHYDFRVRSVAGVVTWVSLSVVPMQWDGKPATLNFLVDITGRKLAEHDLVQANRHLNLLGSITRHDAVNQAMVIEGNADLLAMDNLDEAQRGQVLKIKRSAAAIQRQMQFARLYEEIGAQVPTWQSLQKSVLSAKTSIPLGELQVKTEGPDHLILADPMFEKVVYNLIDNCVRHSGGAKHLTITSSDMDGQLVIVFADDGCGISAGDREHLFERGFGRNTGFGLFLTREILAITGITIRENGAPGKGARFEISVPAGEWRPG